MALLLSGSVLFLCGNRKREYVLPPDVTVNGVEVGGMPLSSALQAVRDQIARGLTPFTIAGRGWQKTYSYPELCFSDDGERVLKRAKAGEDLTLHYERTMPDLEGAVEEVCARCRAAAAEAQVKFNGIKFTYIPEREGMGYNGEEGVKAALAALKRGEEKVVLPGFSFSPKHTVSELKKYTRLLSGFSTSFPENPPREHNIRLAAGKIAGKVLSPGECFSFNETVGKRTKANGFRQANVILNGEFVRGTGGGVCQVSTTLYNAALTAGMVVTESHAHSLSVSYVPYSLDAMVSDSCDLKFVNPFPYPVYLGMVVKNGTITCNVYGKESGFSYKTESVLKERISPPQAEEAEKGVPRAEKDGIRSESYLLVYSGGKRVERKLIRKDYYAPVRGKIIRGEKEES